SRAAIRPSLAGLRRNSMPWARPVMALKLLLQAASGKKTSQIPIWLMRQAGRYLPEYRSIRRQNKNFLDMCYSPEVAYEITMQPIKRFDFDAAILFSDILVLPHALGVNVEFIENIGPKLEIVQSLNDLQKLTGNLSEEKFSNFLQPVFDVITMLKDNLADDKTLIGFAGSPWTVATYMMEGGSSKNFANIKLYMYNHPDEFAEFLNILADYTAIYLLKQIESGADIVKLFDSWAGVLSKKEYENYVIAPNRRIIQAIRNKYPDFPIIGFPKNSGIYYPKYVDETSVNVLAVDQNIAIDWIDNNIRDNVALQGNLDPILLFSEKERIEEYLSNIFSKVSVGRPYIFNLGHGVLPKTPVDNVKFLVDYVKNHRRK
ncbi:MAG: uroporphyrinogen decarboxylase, partial [Pseudomonadota bacterium]